MVIKQLNILIVVAAVVSSSVFAVTIVDAQERNETIEWLRKYEFLKENGLALNDENTIVNAVKDFQTVTGFKPTGVLNDEQRKVMHGPVCLSTRIIPNDDRTTIYFWSKKHLTWRYFPPYDRKFSIPQKTMESMIQKALDMWTDEIDIRTTREMDPRKAADINLRFFYGDHSKNIYTCSNPRNFFDGPGGVLAHAIYPEIGEVHFDLAEYWGIWGETYRQQGHVDMFSVILHELGHTFGIDHSPYEFGTAMRSEYRPPVAHWTKVVMDPRDKLAIRRMYPGNGRAPTIYAWDQSTTAVTKDDPLPPQTQRPYVPQTQPPPPRYRPTIPPRRQPPVVPPSSPPPRYPWPTKRPWWYTTTTVRPIPRGDPPSHDPKKQYFDAAFSMENELVLLKDKQIWRLGYFGLQKNYPMYFNEFFSGTITGKIHSMYRRHIDGYIIAFSDDMYYRFKGNTVIPGYPKKTSVLLGSDVTINRIVPLKGAEYLVFYISDSRVFLFNEYTNRVVYQTDLGNTSNQRIEYINENDLYVNSGNSKVSIYSSLLITCLMSMLLGK